MVWVLPLTYRRPSHVEGVDSSSDIHVNLEASVSNASETAGGTDRSLKSQRSGTIGGIPPALSFDKIIDGGTCPPCTTRDFMNYLIYVERSAENLQFFLWYRDYVKRFKEAGTSDMALAPEWTRAMEDEVIARIQKEHAEKARKEPKSAVVTNIFKGTDFEKQSDIRKPSNASDMDPFSTPPQSPQELAMISEEYIGSNTESYRSQANDAFTLAGAKAPFTIQPFREEIDRVVATYIMDHAPRQLNLSDREQKAVLQALAYTTHPSALRIILKSVEPVLRLQAHPNFIRWSICNGNPPRVFFARALGVGTVLFSFVAALVLTLSSAARGYRALSAIGWVLGIATLIAAYKGMCVVLHGLHHRHVRPWELFVSEEDPDEAGKESFDSFGSSNSYEEEPWVVRYKKRNVVRKILDREIWIQEPALRQIQDTIFVQSMLCAVVLAGILTAVFVLVPAGNLF
ncbi:hypothetical protein B0H66DRAFT_67092 [Apodospora peruviana]|uniref:Regulator of G protein signaling superfamily n=1 Tax=Apodospora peruviana TaxID=516989 RepID=A0AAE0ISN8_9PEZI|nr:hypothetical protein B0H66DRAFT_67092 [Apodospora peruviana]